MSLVLLPGRAYTSFVVNAFCRPRPEPAVRIGRPLLLLADEHEHHEDVEDERADAGKQEQYDRVHLSGLRQ